MTKSVSYVVSAPISLFASNAADTRGLADISGRLCDLNGCQAVDSNTGG